jgi:hypothetical protein
MHRPLRITFLIAGDAAFEKSSVELARGGLVCASVSDRPGCANVARAKSVMNRIRFIGVLLCRFMSAEFSFPKDVCGFRAKHFVKAWRGLYG